MGWEVAFTLPRPNWTGVCLGIAFVLLIETIIVLKTLDDKRRMNR